VNKGGFSWKRFVGISGAKAKDVEEDRYPANSFRSSSKDRPRSYWRRLPVADVFVLVVLLWGVRRGR
jgi:hypothetical protein